MLEDLQRLNRTHAVPGALSFEEGFGGVVARLGSAGSEAVVALQGGQVLSYVPAGSTTGVLWLSPAAKLGTGKAVRGGIPVCWPWFGPHAEPGKPAHGFVRAAPWTVTGAAASQEQTQLTLAFDATAVASELWPYQAQLMLTVAVGRSLKVTLTTANAGSCAIPLTEALHSYFAIGDIAEIGVSGLEARPYIDQLDAGRQKRQAGGIHFSSEVDRIYFDTTDTVTIDDPSLKRTIGVAKAGSRSTVIWNPWIEKGERLGDLGPEGYRRMVCVETCNAGPDIVTLAPGERHSLVQEIFVNNRA